MRDQSRSVKTLPQDVTENFRAGFRDAFRCGVLCVADRVQQRRESCCWFASAAAGERSRCEWRLVRRGASIVRLFVLESLLVSLFAGALGAFVAWRLVPLVPKMASNFLPLEGKHSQQSLPAGARIHDCIVSADRIVDGDLSRPSRLPRGFDGWFKGRRPRNERKHATTTFPQNSRRRASGAFSHIVRRRGVAHHEFYSAEPAEPRVPTADLWTGAIGMPAAQYPDGPSRQRFAEKILAALHNTPGIENAAVSGDIPLAGGNRTLYARADRDVPPVEQRATAPSHDIMPGYLKSWESR